MHMKKLLEKIAQLEVMNDQISTELQYVDRLLRSIGFADGLRTVKKAAKELYEEEKQDLPPDSTNDDDLKE